jgi:alkaline phosphatase D
VIGTFRTAPSVPRDIRFFWSGDTVGQGYGINPDRSPKAGMQFFGEVEIEARSQWMTVRLRDMAGAVLFSRTLSPER